MFQLFLQFSLQIYNFFIGSYFIQLQKYYSIKILNKRIPNQQQKNYQINQQMLHTFTPQYIHYTNTLLQTLKRIYKQTFITDVYITQRCYDVLLKQKITQVDLFGCGYKKIYHKSNITPYLKVQKILVISNINEEQFKQLNEFGYLFRQVHLLSLQNTNSNQVKILRNSTIRKNLKQIQQINLNFHAYLDNAYFVTYMQQSSLIRDKVTKQKLPYTYKRPSIQTKLGSYRSFLLSYPKIYEYELYSVKNSNLVYKSLVHNLQTQLNESLNIMKAHQKDCKSLDKLSSPKIKVLILNRQVLNDFVSPLIYAYYYGPLCEEFVNRQNLFQGAQKLTSKGKMYNKLFQKDFDESSDYIQNITKDKTALDGPFETNYFYKAKHVIATFQDPSPIQIGLHISCWKQSRHLGQIKIKPATLQQDIANRRDQFDRKLSNGDSVSRIKDWILNSQEQDQVSITDDELLRLAVIAQMTGSLWFYHRSSLKKLFQQEEAKNRYQKFIQRKEIVLVDNLTEKYQQSQQRSQLYRHEPKLVPICEKWIRQTLGLDKNNKNTQNLQNIQFEKINVNNDVQKNRQTKLVILIDGIVGYNELALLRRMIKDTTDKQVIIMAQSYCNSQQYLDYITRP